LTGLSQVPDVRLHVAQLDKHFDVSAPHLFQRFGQLIDRIEFGAPLPQAIRQLVPRRCIRRAMSDGLLEFLFSLLKVPLMQCIQTLLR
jgi:hypothetical protein